MASGWKLGTTVALSSVPSRDVVAGYVLLGVKVIEDKEKRWENEMSNLIQRRAEGFRWL
jgi:vacuolar-type H+-ATPase subunit F/Vma7